MGGSPRSVLMAQSLGGAGGLANSRRPHRAFWPRTCGRTTTAGRTTAYAAMSARSPRVTAVPTLRDATQEAPAPVRAVANAVSQWIDQLGVVWVEGQLAQISRRPGINTVFMT